MNGNRSLLEGARPRLGGEADGTCLPRRAGLRAASLAFLLGASSPSAIAQEKLMVLEGDTSASSMHPVAGLDDLNGDGRPELLVGQPSHDGSYLGGGLARVISGEDGSVLREHAGWEDYARMGQHVWDAGDFDGDGTGDYAVVALVLLGTPQWAGEVFLYSGATGAELASVAGTVEDKVLGKVFAAAGDVNADGYGDVLISNNGSPVYVYLGPDLTLLRAHAVPGFQLGAAGLGDLDGDGHDDYAIGTPQDSTVGTWAGKVVVYSGQDGSVMHTVYGLNGKSGAFLGDHLGRSVTGVGDWNEDGVPDFAAGAPAGVLNDDLGVGFVRVYSGADATVLDHVTRPLPGSEFAQFGAKVVGGDDVNGDGFPDLLVGAPLESSPVLQAFEGSATVVSGRDQLVVWKVWGDQGLSRMGRDIDLVGDVNGDGFTDFATGDVSGPAIGGTVIVWAGAPMGSETYCPANPNSRGQPAHLFPAGHLKLRDDRFQITLQQAIPGEPALLFYGTDEADLSFGDGRLCIAPPLFRLPPPKTVGAGGEVAFPLDVQQPPLSSGAGALLPGSTWSFQAWYRDSASTGAGFNTSDALRIQWAPN